MSAENSGPLQTKGFPGVECTATLTSAPTFAMYYSRMIRHSLRVKLLHIVRRSTLSLPIAPMLFFFLNRLRDDVFTELTSFQHV